METFLGDSWACIGCQYWTNGGHSIPCRNFSMGVTCSRPRYFLYDIKRHTRPGPGLAGSFFNRPSTGKTIYSDIFIRANANHSEPIRKTFCISFDEKLIWFNLKHQSEWIWDNRIHSDWYLGSSRIDFWSFFIKRDTKRFSDWFGMIPISLDTYIGMNRNSSDWLGMNFNPILSPGWVLSKSL